MQRPKNLAKAIIVGVAVTAIHFFITMGSFVAIGFSAMSTEPTRIPYSVIEWTFKVCVFPIALLPGTASEGWLLLNSALWGFSLAAVVRWLLSRRKPALTD